MRWDTAWQLVKDVLMTGTGLGLIISQVGAQDPKSVLIWGGLGLTVPAATSHVVTILSGGPSGPPHGPGPSSPPASPPSSSPSSPGEVQHEH